MARLRTMPYGSGRSIDGLQRQPEQRTPEQDMAFHPPGRHRQRQMVDADQPGPGIVARDQVEIVLPEAPARGSSVADR